MSSQRSESAPNSASWILISLKTKITADAEWKNAYNFTATVLKKLIIESVQAIKM